MNNQVQIIGRIARNLELKKIDKTSVINVTLACTRNFKNKEGNYDTDFITCKVFGEKADNISIYCKKGDLIGLRGRIQTGSYEKDGKKVYTTEFIMNDVMYLQSKPKEQDVEVKEEQQEVKEQIDEYEQFSKQVKLEDVELELPF